MSEVLARDGKKKKVRGRVRPRSPCKYYPSAILHLTSIRSQGSALAQYCVKAVKLDAGAGCPPLRAGDRGLLTFGANNNSWMCAQHQQNSRTRGRQGPFIHASFFFFFFKHHLTETVICAASGWKHPTAVTGLLPDHRIKIWNERREYARCLSGSLKHFKGCF